MMMMTTIKTMTMTIMATAPYFFGHNNNDENDYSDNINEYNDNKSEYNDNNTTVDRHGIMFVAQLDLWFTTNWIGHRF